jgi:hypothetical protein
MGSLLSSVFINYLCDAINNYSYLLFADDNKIYSAIKPPTDCNLLLSDIRSLQSWCSANYAILSVNKTNVISFPRKTSILIYDYTKYCQSHTSRTDTVNTWEYFWIPNFISISCELHVVAMSSA